jgi:hypothetical protein
MAWGKKSNGGGGCIAWLALLLSIAALFLSWKAYERTGGDLRQVLATDLGEAEGAAAEEQEEGAGLAEARARLLARRAEVAARENLRQVQDEVAEVRADLRRTFAEAGAEARQSWREVDADLQRLETQLREGSAKAIETLDGAVERMRRLGDR